MPTSGSTRGTRPLTKRCIAILARAIVLLVSLTLALALVEALTYGLVSLGMLESPPPTRRLGAFWDGSHPNYGVWHRSNASWRHQTSCFDVDYVTNSVGARDRERALDGDSGRVVVLGDSFVEGWGLRAEARFSNLLEERFGVEHLNFGMSHFGPYQELLVYRDLAKRYRHDRVIVAITPSNDFFDLDFELAQEARGYEYRYRPYLVGRYPDYTRYDYRETAWRRFGRRNTYAYNAVASGIARMRGEWKPSWTSPSIMLTHSFFYDLSNRQFDLLRYCLEQLQAEAKDKRLAVVLLPVFFDFARFTQVQRQESRLAKQLKQLGAARGFEVVDLLPRMHREDPHWKYFFHDCDYHYGELGSRVVFEELVEALGERLYSDRPEAPEEKASSNSGAE